MTAGIATACEDFSPRSSLSVYRCAGCLSDSMRAPLLIVLQGVELLLDDFLGLFFEEATGARTVRGVSCTPVEAGASGQAPAIGSEAVMAARSVQGLTARPQAMLAVARRGFSPLLRELLLDPIRSAGDIWTHAEAMP